ncbi:MAG: hypothetical protein AAF297_06045 [Planctomycetota bacterium]
MGLEGGGAVNGGRVTPGGGAGAPGGGTGGRPDAVQMVASASDGPPVSSEVLAEALEEEDAPAVDTAALQQRIAELEADLAKAEARLSAQSERITLERELTAAGVVDLETGVALAERLLEMGDEDDPARAVARLRARKPFLFPDGGTVHEGPGAKASRASAMSGDVRGGGLGAIDEMASSARATGDRRELLRYLRARRGS